MPNGGVLLEAEKEYRKQYRMSKWWIEHRDRLRRIGLVAFACFDAIFIIFAVWTFVDTYLVSYQDETRAVLELAAYGQGDLHAYTAATAAKDIEVETAFALVAAEGKYDLYAVVRNPNGDWWAEFDYAFSSSVSVTATAKGFLLPGSEKPLASYGLEASATPRNVTLDITNIVWHRVDKHLTGDYDAWIADRLNFLIEDAAFERLDLDGKTIGRITFTVENDSAFSYYEPAFTIVLTRGPQVVGVTSTTLSKLDAGESAEVVVNWFGTVPAVNKVEVLPDINPFDISVYKQLEGETTEDTRTRVLPRGRR
jgi:hypothetical protein